MNRAEKSLGPAIRWGDRVFQQVYSRYIRPLHAYVLKRVHNHHDAEDITAETFTRALKHLDQPEPDSPEVGAWLFTAARNLSSNFMRSAKRVVTTRSVEDVADPSLQAQPEKEAELDHDLNQLVEALRDLPEEKRRAVVMRFLEELSHSEIAEELGRTETSARVLVHRALQDLRKNVS